MHNGYVLRDDIVDVILNRLHHLHVMLSMHNTFRFYSSSLLIMYDGADCTSPHTSSMTSPSTSTSSQGCDVACDVSGAARAEEESASEEWTNTARECSSNSSSVRGECSQSPPKIKKTSRTSSSTSARAPRVDVKMIDFAHVTHQGFRGDRIVHNGPDHGYLLGLRNLIEIFQKIKERK